MNDDILHENFVNGSERVVIEHVVGVSDDADREQREQQATALLSALWGADEAGNLEGVHFIAVPTSDGAWQHFPIKTTPEAVAKALNLSRDGRNAYFGCGSFEKEHYIDGNGKKRQRTAENATGARTFWLDIDCGEKKAAEGNGYATKAEGFNAAVEFCKKAGLPMTNIIVDSGNGIHCYWTFSEFINRETWRVLARKLKSLAKKYGLIADPTRTADLASVLRVAGTYNWKDPANPKLVKIKRHAGAVDFAAFKAMLDAVVDEKPSNSALTSGVEHPPMTETPENIERVKSMLATIPADCGRDDWRQVCWSVMSTGWGYAPQLIREWSETSDKFTEKDFSGVAHDFKPEGGTGFGTLVHAAKLNGWVDAQAEERFTGSGGDVKNGQLFATVWRNKLLFIHETGELLTFDHTQGWVSAPPGEADRAAKTVLEKLRALAAERYKTAPEDPKTKRIMAHVERTSKAPNLRAMIEMAKSEPGMTVSLNEFDAAPMHLGVANGVIDLRTGALLPVSPDLLVSKRCNVAYDHDAKCPEFMKFLERVQPEQEMRDFLQRKGGYCMTGSVQEQKFGFWYGSGANGKSVLVELQAWLLGDYARKIATEMLMHHQRSPQGPSPDIVALKGCRFVYANETEEGRRLAEARIKDMTGGDTLTGRVPYGKADITFRPTHKLVIVGNHRPEITDNSFGMWRRVALVLFDVTIHEDERDPQLLEKLKAEGAGILNWALEGVRKWKHGGLSVPKKIEAATAAYRDEMDIIGDWMHDHCETGAGCTVRKETAYKAYRTWALSNGHQPLAQGRLTRRLNERGFKLLPDKRNVAGLALNRDGTSAAMRA